MGSLRRAYGYSKVDKEDPEERIHRRAQFLIYKAMDRADSMTSRRITRPSYLRIRIRRLNVRFGKRLTKLRKSMLMTISAAKMRLCRQVKTLFPAGDIQNPNSNAIVALFP